MEIQALHTSILEKIAQDDVPLDINLYFDNQQLYTLLSPESASICFKEIIDGIDRAGRFVPMSIMFKDDSSLCRDPVKMGVGELGEVRSRRQDYPLTQDIFNHILGVYMEIYKMKETKWLNVYDTLNLYEFRVPENQKLPGGCAILDGFENN